MRGYGEDRILAHFSMAHGWLAFSLNLFEQCAQLSLSLRAVHLIRSLRMSSSFKMMMRDLMRHTSSADSVGVSFSVLAIQFSPVFWPLTLFFITYVDSGDEK